MKSVANSSIAVMDQRLLLAIQYACNQAGVRIPFNQAGALIGPAVTEGALVRDLARLRGRLFAAGESVPPLPRRGGQPSTQAGPSRATTRAEESTHPTTATEADLRTKRRARPEVKLATRLPTEEEIEQAHLAWTADHRAMLPAKGNLQIRKRHPGGAILKNKTKKGRTTRKTSRKQKRVERKNQQQKVIQNNAVYRKEERRFSAEAALKSLHNSLAFNGLGGWSFEENLIADLYDPLRLQTLSQRSAPPAINEEATNGKFADDIEVMHKLNASSRNTLPLPSASIRSAGNGVQRAPHLHS